MSASKFSDCYYVTTLMKSICEALMGKREPDTGDAMLDMEGELERQAEDQLDRDCIAEIDRYRRMDEWTNSFQNIYSRTAIQCQRRLVQAKVADFDLVHFLQYTRAGIYELLRLDAFETLADLDLFGRSRILTWFMYTMSSDISPWIRRNLHRIFGKSLANVAFGEKAIRNESVSTEGLVIEQESTTEARQANLSRRQTVPGAIAALKQELGGNTRFKDDMWASCNSARVGLNELRDFIDICSVLYDPVDRKMVKLKYPCYWAVQHLGNVSLLEDNL